MSRFATALLAVLGAAVLTAGAAVAGPPDTATMARLTTDFYNAALSLKQGGIPGEKARARLAPYLSAGLARRLAEGAAAEKSYAALTKGQAPPLLEGDLFTSMFEGASRFRVGDCEAKAERGHCSVAFDFEAQGAAPEHWTDTASLVHTGAGWQIDDIDYGGNWPFANKGTLRANLDFAIANAGGGDQD